MNGKGDARRPRFVQQELFDEAWSRTFNVTEKGTVARGTEQAVGLNGPAGDVGERASPVRAREGSA